MKDVGLDGFLVLIGIGNGLLNGVLLWVVFGDLRVYLVVVWE